MSVVIIILVPSAVGVAGQVNAWIAVDSPDCTHIVRIKYMLENLRNLLRHSLELLILYCLALKQLKSPQRAFGKVKVSEIS